MHGDRSGARSQAEARCGRTVLRARRLSRRRAPAGRADGDHRQGARRPDPAAARRRPAQACGQGLRVRARPAVRHLPADALPPPQAAARGGHRRLRAPGPMGLLLRPPRRTPGAIRMADVTFPDIRETVRVRYAAAARQAAGGGGCCGSESELSCCGPAEVTQEPFGAALYGAEASEAPEAAVAASLGCGVPTAVADLHPGETVLDLGSGAGADVLISARRVAPTGKAIGVDMTDEMLLLARRNAGKASVENVEFVKGHIEDIPLPDGSVDVVISNCVINLSTDKPRVL